MSKAGEKYSQWLHETGGSEAVECYVEELYEKNEKQKDTILHLDSCVQDNIEIIDHLYKKYEDLLCKLYRKDKEIEQLKKYIEELQDEQTTV